MMLAARGHDVTGAESLTAARNAFAEGSFDMLVSDIELPDGSGLDLMRELGATAPTGIAMSGFGSEEDIHQSREAGFSVHLTKPIVAGQLLDAIRQLLPAGHAGA